MKDANGCLATGVAEITTLSGIFITFMAIKMIINYFEGVVASATITNPRCSGQRTGSITITASSGSSGPITYSVWNSIHIKKETINNFV